MNKKIYTLLATVVLVISAWGQVGINTSTPAATLQVNPLKTDGSTSEGFIAPRVTGEQLYNANTQNVYGINQDGTIVFVSEAPVLAHRVGQVQFVDSRGYYYYNSQDDRWIKMLWEPNGGGGTATVTTLECGGVVQNGTGNIAIGVPLPAGVTVTIPYTGGNGKPYPAQSITSTGVLGLTATLSAGTASTSGGNLVYTITGTPIREDVAAIFNVDFAGINCTFSIPIKATLSYGSGSFGGKTCFDVVEVNDSEECGTKLSRSSQKADFTQSSTNTQAYTFTPTGTVSNVRFFYENVNGPVIIGLSGGNTGNNITGPVTATVNFNTLLNQLASGRSRTNALNANIIVVYNDSSNGTGTDKQLNIKVNVQDCACCGAYTAPGVWKNFMCHNLGADETANPFVPAKALNGDYYRFGYKKPARSVDAAYYTWDQTNPYVFNWNGPGKSASDPCPAGFRIPTKAEWQGVIDNNTITNAPGSTFIMGANSFNSGKNFGSALYLPAAGFSYNNGNLANRNSMLGYWSSDVATPNDRYDVPTVYPVYLTYNTSLGPNVRFNGVDSTTIKVFNFSIRCIQE